MKISECKNAPQWLVLADTKNADVEVLASGWVLWNGGYFLGGVFLGGEFRGGVMMPTCKWIYGVNANGKIKIGCQEKTVDEWDAWFASDDEYSTKRGTVEFKKIQACYEATK
jgi:hypothetical protein